MENLTKNGVCYDLHRSPFVSEVKGVRWFFSNKKHKNRFDAEWRAKYEWANDSLSRRFRVTADVGWLALFQLYQTVETRGFYLEDANGEWSAEWPSEVSLGGLQPSARS